MARNILGSYDLESLQVEACRERPSPLSRDFRNRLRYEYLSLLDFEKLKEILMIFSTECVSPLEFHFLDL